MKDAICLTYSDKSGLEALESEIIELPRDGRDNFFTMLICQEDGMWVSKVMNHTEHEILDEAEWLVARRGFNEDESQKFKAVAKWFVDNAERVRQTVLGTACTELFPTCVEPEMIHLRFNKDEAEDEAEE